MLLIAFTMLPVIAAILLGAVKFWRQTIVGIFVWLLVEGAVRKWVFPQFQAPVLVLKDFVLAAAYLGYLLSPRLRVPEAEKLRVLTALVAVLGIYCFLEVLNPALPTPLLAIYGLKNYLMYIPMAFIMPEICRTRKDVHKAVFWIAVLAIPLCLLALYQFSQPATSWVNKYVSHEVGTNLGAAVFGQGGEGEFRFGRARTASTFSYISGFTTYLMLVFPLFAGVLFSSYGRNRETYLLGFVLALSAGATLTTGSRLPVLVFAIALPLMFIAAGGKGLLPLSSALRLAGGTTFITALGYWLSKDAAVALIYRAENSDSVDDRVATPLIETIGAFQTSPLFGLGVGSNSNAAASLGGASLYWLNGTYFEVEPARIMQDLGIIGFSLVYILKIYVIFLVLRHFAASRSKLFIGLHLAIITFIVSHLPLFTINSPTGGMIFWSLIGLSVALHRLENRERAELGILNEELQTQPRGVALAGGYRPG